MSKTRVILSPTLLFALLIVTAIGTSLARGSRAQNQTAPTNNNRPRRTEDLPQPSPTPPKKEDEVTLSGDDVVRVETNLTNIFFTAADKQKRFVNTLKREDIRVLEDGVPQDIFTFQQNTKRRRRRNRFLNLFCAQTKTRLRWFHSPAK